jgi:hypothetical protein
MPSSLAYRYDLPFFRWAHHVNPHLLSPSCVHTFGCDVIYLEMCCGSTCHIRAAFLMACITDVALTNRFNSSRISPPGLGYPRGSEHCAIAFDRYPKFNLSGHILFYLYQQFQQLFIFTCACTSTALFNSVCPLLHSVISASSSHLNQYEPNLNSTARPFLGLRC